MFILVTDFATIAVLIVFAVQGLKPTHALIHFALCVLNWSIVLIRYDLLYCIKPFEAHSKPNRFNLHGK